METLSEIIRNKRKGLGMTQDRLAERVGQSQKTISDWEKGKVTQIRNWETVADVLEIPRDTFLSLMTEAVTLNPTMQRVTPAVREILNARTPVRNDTIRVGESPNIGARDVPVWGQAVGGSDGVYEFNGEELGWEMRPPILAGVKNAYAVYVDGESMFPRYKPGETVWINPNLPAAKGADVIVQLYPDDPNDPPRGFIKEFLGWTPNHLRLHQWNPAKEITFPRSMVKSVHTIVYSQR
jgi:phage repressor protein C with HTH and peptisase S24 domain/DNA-binding XRE family transcriptional regulator